MLAIIPKHKGTDHLQGDIKARIAKLKRLEEIKPGGSARSAQYNVEHEGGGQVALIGPPNSGKSKLLSMISKAQPEIGDYPFTTHKPFPGMMPYEDIKFQIVDMPPITEEFVEPWMPAVARNADAVLFVVDMSDDSVLDQVDEVIRTMEKFRTRLWGWDRLAPPDETGLLVTKKTILVANKMDLPDSAGNLDVVNEFNGERFPVAQVSCVTGVGLEDMKAQVFRMLDVVRVYTKVPGKPADMNAPYVLTRGSTLHDLADMIHKDFAQKLKFARIWGHGKREGVMVGKEQVLDDKDIIELHA